MLRPDDGRDGHDAGLTPLEAARELTSARLPAHSTASGWWATSTGPTRSWTAPRPGTRSMSRALTDMVAFNGGRPLRCVA